MQRKTKRYLLFDDDLRLQGWTNIETGEKKGPVADSQLSTLRSSFARLQGKNSQLSKLAFSGIHVMHPSLYPLFADWPDRFPIMDFYLKACGEHLIRGYEATDLRLMDVGKLDTLDQAESFIKGL